MKHPIVSIALAALASPAPAGGGIEGHVLINGQDLPTPLSDLSTFGSGLARIGDLNKDGVQDLAVGAAGAGEVWILFMNSDGTVASHHRIESADVQPGLDVFGGAVGRLGDVNGDGVPDLAVSGEITSQGADEPFVWVLMLKVDGSVQTSVRYDGAHGSEFGAAVEGVGDLDGDGVSELAIGVPSHLGDEGGVVIEFLNPDGTSHFTRPISSAAGGFAGSLTPGDRFGSALARVGDLDGDGRPELAVGAPEVIGGGAVWVLFLETDGRVLSETLIDQQAAVLAFAFNTGDGFGTALATLGDFDQSGGGDLLVGSPLYSDKAGRVWQVFLDADGSPLSYLEYGPTDLGISVDAADEFGSSVAALDLDGDGFRELVVGAPQADGLGYDRGEAWIFFPEGVQAATLSTFTGCGLNPHDSLTTSSIPRIGATMDLVADNPFYSQTPFSTQVVIMLSVLPSAGGIFGCGTPIPGWNMDPGAPTGELLLLPPFVPAELVWTPTWHGSPTPVQFKIPHEPALLSWVVYAQGVFIDLSPTATLPIALTSGLAMTIGT